MIVYFQRAEIRTNLAFLHGVQQPASDLCRLCGPVAYSTGFRMLSNLAWRSVSALKLSEAIRGGLLSRNGYWQCCLVFDFCCVFRFWIWWAFKIVLRYLIILGCCTAGRL